MFCDLMLAREVVFFWSFDTCSSWLPDSLIPRIRLAWSLSLAFAVTTTRRSAFERGRRIVWVAVALPWWARNPIHGRLVKFLIRVFFLPSVAMLLDGLDGLVCLLVLHVCSITPPTEAFLGPWAPIHKHPSRNRLGEVGCRVDRSSPFSSS